MSNVPIERYLMTGEKVLAETGGFYATNRRIIRYRNDFMGEEIHDLVYEHLSSISYVSRSRSNLVDLGVIIIVLGIVGIVVNLFVEESLVTPLCIVGACLGVLLVLYGIFSKVTYVQFRGAGISDASGAKLRMSNGKIQEAKKIITLVREHTRGS